MKNMKVSVKLTLGFLIITGFAILLACIGVFALTTTNSNYVYLIQGPVDREIYLRRMQTEFMTMRYRSANFVMNSGDAEFINETLLPQYQSAHDSLQQNLADYIESNNTDTRRDPAVLKSNKEAADKLTALLDQYQQTSQLALNASLADDAGAADAALKDAIPLTNDINTLMGELTLAASAFVDEMAEDMRQSAKVQTIVLVAITVVCFALALLLAVYISRLISRPLVLMGTFLTRFGTQGDLCMSEEDEKSYASRAKDEIGQCQETLGAVIFRLQAIEEALGQVAEGDLTTDLQPLSEVDSMGLAITRMVGSLNGMFGEIRSASGQVSSGAGQVAQGAQVLASGSSEQAASIQQFSASLVELLGKTNNNAENSAKAREANETAGVQLQDSVKSMNEVLRSMKSIDESSTSITKVIKVIDDIAFQTNILALNAAVEAARAGQHGKGFAVVADEVRNLASKSAAAAKETASLIEGSSARVREGDQIVKQTSTSLESLAENAQELARLVGEVAVASTEQTRSIQEINQGIEQISTVVQSNSATAEQSAAAAEEMSAQAVVLNEIVAKFQLKQPTLQKGECSVSTASRRPAPADPSGFALSQDKY